MVGKFKKCSLVSLTLSLILSAAPALAEGTAVTASQWNNFFWRIIVFSVFVGILFFLLRKPVSKFFKGRQEDIAHTLNYLETQAKNLEEQTQIMAKKMDDISAERESIIARFEQEGMAERDKLIAEAKETAERIKKQAEVALAQEIAQAREVLKVQAILTASKMAEDLLKKSITNDDQGRLTQDFMAQVSALESENKLN